MNEIQHSACDKVRLIENLLRLSHQTMMQMDVALEDAGLTGAKMWALKHLMESDEPLGVTALADCMGSGKSNATQIIDRLETEGLVRRVPHPEDRRSIRVEVTEEGARRYEVGVGIRASVSASILETLNTDEQQQFESLLDKLLAES